MKNASVLSVVLAVSAVFTVSAETVTYDLQSVYVPYLTTTPTKAWEGRSLSEVVSASGVMKGGWIASDTNARGFIYNCTGNCYTVQFQAKTGTDLKVVRACLRQQGEDIYAWAEGCGIKSNGNVGYYLLPSETADAISPDGTTGKYGIHLAELASDTVKTIDAFPDTSDEVQVNGGMLGIKIPAERTIANAISGTGGIAWVPNLVSRSFDGCLTEVDQTVLSNVDIMDLDLNRLTASLGGVFMAVKASAIRACNVVWAEDLKSFTAQFQYMIPSSSYVLRGAVVRYAQSGNDIVARVVVIKQATEGRTAFGADILNDSSWVNGNSNTVATEEDGKQISVHHLGFAVRQTSPTVTLAGTKTFTGGMLVDGTSVVLANSYLPKNAAVTVKNGGELTLAADRSMGTQMSYTYTVLANSTLHHTGVFALDRTDKLILAGGTFDYVSGNIYANDVVLSDGARMTGETKPVCVSYNVNSTWVTSGTKPIDIDVPVRLYCENVDKGLVFSLSTAADIDFKKPVDGHTGYKGLKLLKQGPSNVVFEAGMQFPNNRVELAAGAMVFKANSAMQSLTVSGAVRIEVDEGAVLSIGDSSACTWTGTLDVVTKAPKAVRFGTGKSALTKDQLARITLNGNPVRLDGTGYLADRFYGMVLLFR